MEAEEWVAGKTAAPILISLREGYVPTKQRDLKVSRRSLLQESRPAAAAAAAATPSTGPSATYPSAMSQSTAMPAASISAASGVCMKGYCLNQNLGGGETERVYLLVLL